MMPTLPASTLRSPSVSRRDALRLLGLAGAGALLGPALARAAGNPATAAAPSLAGAQPGHYRFSIGSIEALALNDGGFAMPPPDSPFGIGEPREKVTEALNSALVPTDLVRLPFNVMLLRLGAELVLIDAGCGPAFGPAGGRLVANLATAGVMPEQITGIILSHMHGDHFGGLLDANGEVVFRNAKVFMHRVEHEYWTANGDENVQKYLHAFKGKWQLIGGGEKLLGGLEIAEAFGHTPGHIMVGVHSGSESLLHFVDVVHSHVLSFAHPEWVMKFDVQSDVAIATRRRVLDRCATDRTRVFGAHMPFPALVRVRRSGSAFEYVIEPWMWA
jgi:glyoxylase-like metal-dependent hydrolase (beta-lactamase superfamily II)